MSISDRKDFHQHDGHPSGFSQRIQSTAAHPESRGNQGLRFWYTRSGTHCWAGFKAKEQETTYFVGPEFGMNPAGSR